MCRPDHQLNMSLPSDHDRRLQNARLALDGLSVGDAFGQQFFAELPLEIATRRLPPPIWRYTDDTEMALAIFEVLRDGGTIDQDLLANRFARRYQLEYDRGYGERSRRWGGWRWTRRWSESLLADERDWLTCSRGMGESSWLHASTMYRLSASDKASGA